MFRCSIYFRPMTPNIGAAKKPRRRPKSAGIFQEFIRWKALTENFISNKSSTLPTKISRTLYLAYSDRTLLLLHGVTNPHKSECPQVTTFTMAYLRVEWAFLFPLKYSWKQGPSLWALLLWDAVPLEDSWLACCQDPTCLEALLQKGLAQLDPSWTWSGEALKFHLEPWSCWNIILTHHGFRLWNATL